MTAHRELRETRHVRRAARPLLDHEIRLLGTALGFRREQVVDLLAVDLQQ